MCPLFLGNSTLIISFNSFAECPFFIRNAFINSDENAFENSVLQEILLSGLVDKGFTIVDSEDEAFQVLNVSAASTSGHNSIWEAKVNIYSKSGHKGHSAHSSDRSLMIPLHVLTLGFTTLIPTKGLNVMKRLVKKLPTCEQVTKDIILKESLDVH